MPDNYDKDKSVGKQVKEADQRIEKKYVKADKPDATTRCPCNVPANEAPTKEKNDGLIDGTTNTSSQIRSINRGQKIPVQGLEGGNTEIRFRDLPPGAKRLVRNLKTKTRVGIGGGIKVDDLRQASMYMNRELGVAIDRRGKLIAVRGVSDTVSFRQSDKVLVHTHPVFESRPVHFLRDFPAAGRHTEAVIDWGGNITHFNKTGLLDNITHSPINDNGMITGAGY